VQGGRKREPSGLALAGKFWPEAERQLSGGPRMKAADSITYYTNYSGRLDPIGEDQPFRELV
jgi:hypothetical protein